MQNQNRLEPRVTLDLIDKYVEICVYILSLYLNLNKSTWVSFLNEFKTETSV